jgi:hypothetical protein
MLLLKNAILKKSPSIKSNIKKNGVVSKRKRQIDILVEGNIAGFKLEVIIDCKYFNKKIDIKVVESFISFLHDLKASKGVLITNKGYTQAAKNRAEFDTQDIELRVIEFNELKDQHALLAMPYKIYDGYDFGCAAMISAPEGWIIDSQPQLPYSAVLYPNGFTEEMAATDKNGGFMYIGFIVKDKEYPNLQELQRKQDLKIQNNATSQGEIANIEYISILGRGEETIPVRKVYIHSGYGGLEYTSFIDAGIFIIFLVLLEPNTFKDKYLKKLEWLGKHLVPIKLMGDIDSFRATPE